MPSSKVNTYSMDYQTMVDRARGGPEEPINMYPGEGSQFPNTRHKDGIYDKPTSIVDGEIVHTPDPE